MSARCFPCCGWYGTHDPACWTHGVIMGKPRKRKRGRPNQSKQELVARVREREQREDL